MTNTELLSKIKDFANEQKELLSGFELQSDFRKGETAAYSAIISFLSTIELEKPNNHLEGLDDAAKNYALNTAEDSEQYSARYLGYKDGAKWQAKRMKDEEEKE